jgi:hypothetical protein
MNIEQLKLELVPILQEKKVCKDSITQLQECKTYTDLWRYGITELYLCLGDSRIIGPVELNDQFFEENGIPKPNL